MKFLTHDLLFPAISVIIITTFSVLLYVDFNKKIDAGNLKQIGIVTFKHEVAQRKYQSQVVWEGIDQNNPVYNNDSIRTSDASEAVIHLPDGTDINIEENSMIMLSTLAGGININFEQGSISANRSGVSGTDIAAINIKSQDATISIDKSNIQLTQLDNKELDLTVSDGIAKVKSGAVETVVKMNEAAVISSDRKDTRVVQLQFNLKEPGSNRFYIIDSQKTEIVFSWDVAGKFKDTTWEISKDRSFSKILTSQKNLTVNTFKTDLEAGVYYWRISGINLDSEKIEYSEIGKFNLVYRKPVKLISPQSGDTLMHSASQNSVIFKWSEDSLASDYILEISQDKDFALIINKINTPLRIISIDNLNQGEYFWRVNSSISIGGELIVKTGSSSSFKIDKLKSINPPVLISPGIGEKIDAAVMKSKGIILSWNNDSSFTSYEVEISSDKDFKKVIQKQQRKVNYAQIKNEIASGTYFWRVKGLVSSGEKIPFSDVGEFDVVINETLSLIYPLEQDEIKISAGTRKRNIKFNWKKTALSGNYKLQISRKEDFSGIKSTNFKNQNSGNISIDEPGEYYWRVVLTDKKDKEIIKSDIAKFRVTSEEVIPEIKTMLIVKSPAKRGKIYIDSKFRGYSEIKMGVRPDVNMKVKIVAAGYSDFNTQVKVKAGDTFTLSPAMEKVKKLNRVNWVSPLSTPLSSAPVYYKDKIFLCSENGYIVIMDQLGKVLVSKKITKRFESRVVVYDDNIYAVDVSGVLYSIDSSSGKVNWQIKSGGPLLFKSELVISGGKIFLATGYGVVESYDLKGVKIWSTNLDEAIYNSLLVTKGSLIIATDSLTLYSLDSEDGGENWSTEIDEKVITLTPLVHKNIIYFGCYSGTFYAISLDGGDVIWTFKSGGPVYSSPVVVEKSIYFGSQNGYVYSLDDQTGKLNWKFKSPYPVVGSPLYAFGSIVVADDRTIFSLNPLNGEILWQNTFSNKIKTSPTFAGETVIIGLVNGDIVSVRNNLIEVSQ